MHCPNCGTKTSSEHRFCRACGLSLEKFALLLAEELPDGEAGRAQAEELARLAARGRRVGYWLNAAAFTFISLLVGVVLYGIVATFIVEKGQVLAGLIFLCIVLLGLAFAGLILYRESLKGRLQKRGKPAEDFEPPLPRAEAADRLLPDASFEPVPSVTEATTELLTVKKSRQ